MLNSLFLDMNSYFASVEQQLRRDLRDQPVVVTPVLAETGCCIAASYEAKAFGIRTGTLIRQARELCPQVRVVEARPEVYARMHERFLAAMESCIPVEKVYSIDEACARLIGEQRQPAAALALAKRVKQAVREQAGDYLRCSIGLAPNHFLAKVASDMQKPDGLTMLTLADLPDKLLSLGLMDLPGIGARMHERLRQRGVRTIEQLYAATEKELGELWGSVVGRKWWYWLRGYDITDAPTRRQSLSRSHVLPPELRTPHGAHAVLVRLIHKAAAQLRRMNYWAGEMSVYLSFSSRDEGWQKSVSLGQCQDTLTMIEGLERLWPACPRHRRPTQVAVTLYRLVAAHNASQPLFTDLQERRRLAVAMDEVNAIFGGNTIYFGGMHDVRKTAPTRIGFANIPDKAAWNDD